MKRNIVWGTFAIFCIFFLITLCGCAVRYNLPAEVYVGSESPDIDQEADVVDNEIVGTYDDPNQGWFITGPVWWSGIYYPSGFWTFEVDAVYGCWGFYRGPHRSHLERNRHRFENHNRNHPGHHDRHLNKNKSHHDKGLDKPQYNKNINKQQYQNKSKSIQKAPTPNKPAPSRNKRHYDKKK